MLYIVNLFRDEFGVYSGTTILFRGTFNQCLAFRRGDLRKGM